MKKKNKKKFKFLFFLLLLLLLSLFLPLVIPDLTSEIQRAEMQSLVVEKNLNKKINYLYPISADETIKKKNGITVMFAIPNGKLYTDIIRVFKDSQQMNLFNRTLYIYPIIYQSQEIEKKYNINKNQITMIFFENGKAQNSFLVTQELNIKNDFISLLNQLPLTTETANNLYLTNSFIVV